jgi:hypothetical protein
LQQGGGQVKSTKNLWKLDKKKETNFCKKCDQASNNGRSPHLEHCDLECDTAQMALDLLAAIIEAIKGSRYVDTDDYKQDKIKGL